VHLAEVQSEQARDERDERDEQDDQDAQEQADAADSHHRAAHAAVTSAAATHDSAEAGAAQAVSAHNSMQTSVIAATSAATQALAGVSRARSVVAVAQAGLNRLRATTQGAITLTTDTTLVAGRRAVVTVRGTVLKVAGATVVLQKQDAEGAWATVSSARMSATGIFTAVLRTGTAPGITTYRVYVAATDTSASFAVTVK